MKLHIFASGLLLAVSFTACSGEKKGNNGKKKGDGNKFVPSLPNEVTVMPLKSRFSSHELISNGKVTAQDYADLYFRTSEVVANIWVKNGDIVRKGQKIANGLFKLNNTLVQNKNSLAQATLEMQDVLIGQGYAPDNLKVIPADVLELAKVKSGYEQSKAQYEYCSI